MILTFLLKSDQNGIEIDSQGIDVPEDIGLKSDQNGIEIKSFSIFDKTRSALKSDQNGIEMARLYQTVSVYVPVKIRPKWD